MQLINRLSAIKGVNHVRLHLNNAAFEVIKISNRSELEKQLSDLMLKYNPRIFKDLKPMAKQYIAKDGAKRKHLLLTPILTASPIIIAGVPFEIKVTFAYAPGLEVRNSEAVLIEKRGGYAFPLVISEISLTSNAASLADRFQNIAKIIETKYRKFDTEADRLLVKPDSSVEGSVSDKEGNMLSVNVLLREASFTYTSEKYQAQLGEVYRKHIAEGELKNNSDKTDMGTGL